MRLCSGFITKCVCASINSDQKTGAADGSAPALAAAHGPTWTAEYICYKSGDPDIYVLLIVVGFSQDPHLQEETADGGVLPADRSAYKPTYFAAECKNVDVCDLIHAKEFRKK